MSGMLLALPLFASTAIIAIFSFLPRLNLSRSIGKTFRRENLLFFGDVATMSIEGYEKAVRESYRPEADHSVTDNLISDLSVQIVVNSGIADRKFKLFNRAAGFVLMSLIVLLAAILTWAWRYFDIGRFI